MYRVDENERKCDGGIVVKKKLVALKLPQIHPFEDFSHLVCSSFF
jgi:hypothetical protein